MRLDMNRRSSNTTRYESCVEMKQYNEESSPSFSSLISNWNRNVPQGSVTAQKTKGVHMTSNDNKSPNDNTKEFVSLENANNEKTLANETIEFVHLENDKKTAQY